MRRIFNYILSIAMVSIFAIVVFQYDNSKTSYTSIAYFVIILVAVFTLFGLQQYSYRQNLKKLRTRINALMEGNLEQKEIALYTRSFRPLAQSLDKLSQTLKERIGFIQKIGDGNYEAHLEIKNEQDTLGLEFKKIQEKLKTFFQENENQTWINNGLIKFGALLRETLSIQDLCALILSNLVEYLQIQQGGLLLLAKDEDHNPYLELIATYAYSEAKMLEKKIEVGSGLVGQVFLDKKTKLLDEIPNNWEIESALGNTKPASILLVPLKFYEDVIGVLELASLVVFQPHQIEFVEKIAEHISATLLRQQSSERTQDLLLKSQEQAEELQAREEEIKMHLEELQASNDQINQRSRQLEAQHQEIQEKNKNLLEQRHELEKMNKKMQENEDILKKSFAKTQKQAEELKRNNEEIKVKNAQIEEIHDHLTSSIEAALTIQQAILPSPQKMTDLLKDYFVLYYPKDNVSGDFYWTNQVENSIFIAVADCTGHGVPGAFMSVIGNSLLDKIILSDKIYEPAQILYQLHQGVYNLLKQAETKNNNGMDLGICRLEKLANKQTRITFVGAKRPLYYFKQQSQELVLLKGDRRSIGGEQNENIPFLNQEVLLEKGDSIYMGSDGYTDQNDINRKRFGEAKFQELMTNWASLPLNQQKNLLSDALRNHMKGTNQRDDILLLGVKIE